MSLDEFWRTTPGEVALAMYAASERRLDRLELGIREVWLGRVVSHMKNPDPQKVLPPRRGRKTASSRSIDQAFTAQETARWKQHFADLKAAEGKAP